MHVGNMPRTNVFCLWTFMTNVWEEISLYKSIFISSLCEFLECCQHCQTPRTHPESYFILDHLVDGNLTCWTCTRHWMNPSCLGDVFSAIVRTTFVCQATAEGTRVKISLPFSFSLFFLPIPILTSVNCTKGIQ